MSAFAAASAVPSEPADTNVLNQLWNAFVDRVTASVSEHLEHEGIASIVLKGPAFKALLYADGTPRFYTDADLLVSSTQYGQAETILRELGFVRVDRDEDWLGPEPKYARTYSRPADGAVVDLHWRLSGAMAPAEKIWSAMRRHVGSLILDGRRVHVLDAAASALVIGLHNAHHGNGRPSTLADLDRAVQLLDPTVWREAVCLADELQASDAFAAGLRLTAAGSALADRLCLDRLYSVEMWLKTNPSTYGAYVLDRLVHTPTTRRRLRLVSRVAFPPRVVMWRFFPMARRGPLGLTFAYMLRPLRLAAHAGPAIRDWMRARRQSGRDRPAAEA